MGPVPRISVGAALLVGAAAVALAAKPTAGTPATVGLHGALRQEADEDFLASKWTLSKSYTVTDLLSGDLTPQAGEPDPNDTDDDRCPMELTFESTTEPSVGVKVVANGAIVQDGERCSGPGEFVFVSPAVLKNLDSLSGSFADTVREMLGAVDGAASVFNRFVQSAFDKLTGAPVYMGVATEEDRECGDREVEGRTFAASLLVNSTIDIVGSLSLPAGRHLLTYTIESNPVSQLDNPLCLYLGVATNGSSGGSGSSGSNNPACFPASATVELSTGATVTMADLAIGDMVRVAEGSGDAAFSPVYTFTHRSAGGDHPVVTATTRSGHSLTATPGHLVYINGVATPMRSVRVGDALDIVAEATSSVVTSVSDGTAAGVYNPQTLAGDIVVDGIRASTYTTAVAPAVAAPLLAPVRALYRLGVTGSWLEAGGQGRLAGALLRALPLGGTSA
ncbi:hypothetical protein MMPV_005678 [Pyropia vietnamensis]